MDCGYNIDLRSMGYNHGIYHGPKFYFAGGDFLFLLVNNYCYQFIDKKTHAFATKSNNSLTEEERVQCNFVTFVSFK